ncbi:MAG TPA: hypothetical protein VF741_07430, partial [Candidatus Aquilonibacter sp.]
MNSRSPGGRGIAVAACLVAVLATYLPARGQTVDDNDRVLGLLNHQSCAVHEAKEFAADVDRAGVVPEGSRVVAQFQFTPSPSPSPTGSPNPYATPSPFPTPTFGPHSNSTTTLIATPVPQGTPGITPLPIPTATPNPWDQNQPVFVTRGGGTPPAVTPAGGAPRAMPTAAPSGTPTLAPNY